MTDERLRIHKNDFRVMDTEAPHYEGWAQIYVMNEWIIPESWRDRFYDELVSEDLGYRRDLENEIRIHGVRWRTKNV